MNGDYDRFLLSSVTIDGARIYDIQLSDDGILRFLGIAREDIDKGRFKMFKFNVI